MLSSGDSTKFYVGWLRLPEIFEVRDGPLENLWGGGGGEVQKKYSRKGKLNEKKFMHAN